MSRSDGDWGGDGTRGANGFLVDRRSYLKLAGTTAGAALLSGPASAASSRRGITFKRTVDMVADAGCDPTGSEPCDQQIRDAADDFTLLKFPAGEYKITERNFIYDKTNIGFLGVGDVRFSVPERFNEKLLVVDGGTGVLFEGIDIDQTAEGATPALHLGAEDDLRVHDVELIGQGIHPDSIPKGQPGYSPGQGPENGNPDVHDYFYPIVRSADGTGLITDLVANNHGLMGTYNAGNGRSGIWVGLESRGTTTFRDCHIEEFGSNGTYTSRTYGVVQFEGGVYRNNDNNQIRLGSAGSYIEDAILVVDTDSSEAPNPDEGLNYRGARIEMGHNYVATDVAIRNSDIAVLSTPHSSGAVVAQRTVSEFQIENSRITVDADGVYGVLALEPNGGGAYAPPPKPHTSTLQNVSITGDATGGAAVKVIDRPNSVIDNCCIQQNGVDRDGLVLIRSDGTRVTDTTIDVGGQHIDERDSATRTENISTGGSCPVANYGAGDYLPHKLTFESNGGRYSYTVSVSDDIGKSTVRGATLDPNDTVQGHTASGQGGGGGIDSYGFSGEIVGFDLEGDATVYLDDEHVDPGRFPANTIAFESNGGGFSYSFAVSGDLEKSTAVGASIDDNDRLSGATATGQGGSNGVDSYEFTGELVGLDFDGDATVSVNGDSVDADRYPTLHTLTIEGVDTRTDYTFSASRGVANNGGMTAEDSITGSRVTGAVGGGTDSYAFAGDITDFSMSSDADLRLDGEKVPVTEFLPHTLTVNGGGSFTEYSFSVSGGVAGRDGHSREDVIDIQHGQVDGAVGGGRDRYAFSGALETFTLESDARIVIDPSARTVTAVGTGDLGRYHFTTTGRFRPTYTLTGEDEIDGGNATGAIRGGRDVYRYTGEIREIRIGGSSVQFS